MLLTSTLNAAEHADDERDVASLDVFDRSGILRRMSMHEAPSWMSVLTTVHPGRLLLTKWTAEPCLSGSSLTRPAHEVSTSCRCGAHWSSPLEL